MEAIRLVVITNTKVTVARVIDLLVEYAGGSDTRKVQGVASFSDTRKVHGVDS